MSDIEKKPLMSGRFVWAVSKKDGKFKPIIGPDPLEATDDDIFLIADTSNYWNLIPVEHPNLAIKDFITLKPGEYAVITNPAENFLEGFPNGSYSRGRNEMKDLAFGKKRVVIGGHFPLWPGQFVEKRKVHHLSASQYLVVMVESLDVDEDAPYYDLTVKCANITTAVVDETVASKDHSAEDVQIITEMTSESDKDPNEKETEKSQKKKITIFKLGQRIIIPGNLTPTYIPPSGIEIVSGEMQSQEEDETNIEGLNSDQIIEKMIQVGLLKIEGLKKYTSQAGISEEDYSLIYKHYVDFRSQYAKNALKRAIIKALNKADQKKLADVVKSVYVKKEPTKDAARMIHDAVVLGPTQYCVLYDENGDPKTHVGFGRVFPGPYDRFRTEGSRNKVYDTYHIRTDRGILFRVIATSITQAELYHQLPKGNFELNEDVYYKGDELFIGGFDAYLVPSNSIEVINPETRQPHIGNDHSEVYVQAIGIDQRSGVYVTNVDTGNVKTVSGEIKLLLDPRNSKHIKRKIPGYLWNLMIGRSEPHKMIENKKIVETPWALSIQIPNNEAVLVVGKDGRRPVTGPCHALLEYEEMLEVLTLSQGCPKTEENQLDTCFLRIAGNRVTDTITLNSSNQYAIDVNLEYSVRFVGETAEESEKWFNHKDYVMLLCANLRSRLRAAAEKIPLTELVNILPDFIRDTVLGKKIENQSHRPGLLFDENNMLVNEVQILSHAVHDNAVYESIKKTNQSIVTQLLEDTAKTSELESEKKRAEIAQELAEISKENADRDRDVSIKLAEARTAIEQYKQESTQRLAMLNQQYKMELQKAEEIRLNIIAKEERNRKEEDERSIITLNSEKDAALIKMRSVMADLQKLVTQTESEADVARLQAIQPKLIEALEGLGDKQLMTVLAENLPQSGGVLGFLSESGGFAALKSMVKGTKFEEAMNTLLTEDKMP